MDTFARRLREQREKRGISQNEMASILNIKETAYQHYEYGRVKPKVETLTKMAEFFEVSTDFLLGLTDNNETKRSKFEDNIKKSIATILRAERKRIGITQKQMADQLNLGYTTYQQYENCKRMPLNELLVHMANYFHIEMDMLLGRKK